MRGAYLFILILKGMQLYGPAFEVNVAGEAAQRHWEIQSQQMEI
nr:hypothetical protein Iba_chr15dCG3480 [Ipomoea batatas]GME14847.1 hypothetical protein Iba_scaffold15503CG0190 [Ipomoea batatas]